MSGISGQPAHHPISDEELKDVLTRLDALPAELSSAIGTWLPVDHKRAVSRASVRIDGQTNRVLRQQIRMEIATANARSFANTSVSPGAIAAFFRDKTKILGETTKIPNETARADALMAFGDSAGTISNLNSRRFSAAERVMANDGIAQLADDFIRLSRDLPMAHRSQIVVASLAGHENRWMQPIAREGVSVLQDMPADAPGRRALLDAVIDRIDLADNQAFDAIVTEIERSPPGVMMRGASVMETNPSVSADLPPAVFAQRFNRLIGMAANTHAPNRWEMAFFASRLANLPATEKVWAARKIAHLAAECPANVPASAARPTLQPFTRDEFLKFVIGHIEQNTPPQTAAAITAPLQYRLSPLDDSVDAD